MIVDYLNTRWTQRYTTKSGSRSWRKALDCGRSPKRVGNHASRTVQPYIQAPFESVTGAAEHPECRDCRPQKYAVRLGQFGELDRSRAVGAVEAKPAGVRVLSQFEKGLVVTKDSALSALATLPSNRPRQSTIEFRAVHTSPDIYQLRLKVVVWPLVQHP